MNTSVHIYVTRTYPKDTPTTTKKIETIQLNQNVTNVTQTKWPFTSATVMKWMQLHKTLQPVPPFLLWSLHSIWLVAPIWIEQGLTSHKHIIGHIGNGFYRSKDPTNGVKALKEERS